MPASEAVVGDDRHVAEHVFFRRQLEVIFAGVGFLCESHLVGAVIADHFGGALEWPLYCKEGGARWAVVVLELQVNRIDASIHCQQIEED